MAVDGEGLPGKALEKRWGLSLFLKAGRVEMDERWPGSLFQSLEATDENDLDFAIPVIRKLWVIMTYTVYPVLIYSNSVPSQIMKRFKHMLQGHR